VSAAAAARTARLEAARRREGIVRVFIGMNSSGWAAEAG